MPIQSKRNRKSHRRPNKSRSKARSAFSPPRVGPAFDKLVAVMNRLRAPGGCPWDREQTHTTLRTYLVEEAYEVLDALDSADDAKFAEELGDLLLQVLFHAQIAREESRFSIADVIREIYEKMIRRHPHVFGEKRAKDAAEVLRNWEIIKQQERQSREVVGGRSFSSRITDRTEQRAFAPEEPPSVLDGVPHTLPALLEALQLTRKAARIGFDWNSIEGIFAKLDEETGELRKVLPHRRRTGRHALRRRQSGPLPRHRSRDRPQENQRQILPALPGNGTRGPFSRHHARRSPAPTDGVPLGPSQTCRASEIVRPAFPLFLRATRFC